eukprot:COSAG01_NODE_3663_length_5815_cov_10.892932_2_plen_193_part_00
MCFGPPSREVDVNLCAVCIIYAGREAVLQCMLTHFALKVHSCELAAQTLCLPCAVQLSVTLSQNGGGLLLVNWASVDQGVGLPDTSKTPAQTWQRIGCTRQQSNWPRQTPGIATSPCSSRTVATATRKARLSPEPTGTTQATAHTCTRKAHSDRSAGQQRARRQAGTQTHGHAVGSLRGCRQPVRPTHSLQQ